MRRSSLAAAAFMVLSRAAMAQVSRTTDGKDVPYANQLPANAAIPDDVNVARNTVIANDTAPAGGAEKTEAAAPRR